MKIKRKDAPFDHYVGKPDTSWYAPLVAVAAIITVCGVIYVVMSLVDAAKVV